MLNLVSTPTDNKPEVAFARKPNVGKSSLINSMIYRKALARTSQNPGKTRTMDFDNVEDLLYLVDLPGYGYAKASHSEIEKWGKIRRRLSYKERIFKGYYYACRYKT